MPTYITPSHTCGPLFGFNLLPAGIDHTVAEDDPRAVVIEGQVLDFAGQHLAFDAFLEFWSAGQACRARTLDGRFRAVLARPAPVAIPGAGVQAPHIHIAVFARGLTRHLVTRMYFAQDSAAHASDPVLQQIAPQRCATLMGQPTAQPGHYQFDIRLQGADETVFFDTTLGPAP